MISLVSVELKNFISHSHTLVNFSEEQKLIITGRSGFGKSAIVQAILWSCYGRARSNNLSLIKKGTKEAVVELILFDNKSKIYYKIVRSITSKNKHNLEVLSSKNKNYYKPVLANGIKELQTYIEKEILHSSYILFVNSILYPQNNHESFILQTANKRKDILLEITRAEDYDNYYKKARKKLEEEKLKAQDLLSTIVEKEDNLKNEQLKAKKIEEYKEKNKSLTIQIEKLENKHSNLLDKQNKIKTQIVLFQQKSDKIKEIIKNINKNENKITSINDRLEQNKKIDKEKITNKVEELNTKRKILASLEKQQTEYLQWQKELSRLMANKPPESYYDEEIDKLNQQMIQIIKEGIEMCPVLKKECPVLKEKQENNIKFLEEEVKDKQKLKEAQEEERQKYSQAIEKLGHKQTPDSQEVESIKEKIKELKTYEKKLIELNSLEQVIKDLSNERKELQEEQLSLKKQKQELEKDLQETSLLEEKNKKIKQEINELLIKKGSLSDEKMKNYSQLSIAETAVENIKKNQIKIKELQKEKNKVLKNIDALELIKEAFSNTGIKAIVVDLLIPKLEVIINDTLSKLSNFQVKLSTQKSGTGKNVVLEGLFLSVVNENGDELAVENLSGGELIKVTMSIYEGLASLQKCSFRIMDEAVIGLDAETITGFSEVMLQLQKNVKQLICISHISELQDLFEEQLEIVKINGNSKVA